MGTRAAIAVAIFAAVSLVRLPFVTTHLWAWDSVLYARALEMGFHVDADASASRPHPPGYIWYVGVARLVRAVVGDSNAALVLVSILAGAAAAALLWLIASRYVRPGVALATAGAFAASPVVWAYSEVAYPYTVLAAVSLIVGWLFIDGRRPLLASLAFGLLAGARQDILVLFGPLWLWSVSPLGRGRAAAAAAFVALGVAAWGIPSALLSGGPVAYGRALLQQGGFVASVYSAPAHGPQALVYNTAFTAEALAWGLGLFVVPLVIGIARLAPVAGRRRRMAVGRVGTGLVVWAVPALVFYAFVHIGEWGYVLSVLPALYLAAAIVVDRMIDARPSPRWVGAGAAAVLASAALFVAGDAAFGAVVGNAEFSAAALARHDRELAAQVAYVREHFAPRTTVVLARDDYQLVRYYLSEYRAWYWDPDPYAPRSSKKKRAMQPTNIVVFTAGLQPLRPAEIRRVAVAAGILLTYIPVDRGSVFELDGERYVVREAPDR